MESRYIVAWGGNTALLFVLVCVDRSVTVYFSIQDAGAEILGNNCQQILGDAPTSRSYAPAADCVRNAHSVCCMWMCADMQFISTGMTGCVRLDFAEILHLGPNKGRLDLALDL